LALHSRKGREKHGKCLVEGKKVIEAAGTAVDFTFTRADTDRFDTLVTTETPQDIAGVASVPDFSLEEVEKSKTIVVLDGVQDPGNVGTILRLCQGFGATLLLVDSADPTSPKVVRSSAGATFSVPWVRISRDSAAATIAGLERSLFRLEQNNAAQSAFANSVFVTEPKSPVILIAGSEGHGITLPLEGESIVIPHQDQLESLNVASALSIALHARYSA